MWLFETPTQDSRFYLNYVTQENIWQIDAGKYLNYLTQEMISSIISYNLAFWHAVFIYSELQKLHMKFVLGKILQESEFWATRKVILIDKLYVYTFKEISWCVLCLLTFFTLSCYLFVDFDRIYLMMRQIMHQSKGQHSRVPCWISSHLLMVRYVTEII